MNDWEWMIGNEWLGMRMNDWEWMIGNLPCLFSLSQSTASLTLWNVTARGRARCGPVRALLAAHPGPLRPGTRTGVPPRLLHLPCRSHLTPVPRQPNLTLAMRRTAKSLSSRPSTRVPGTQCCSVSSTTSGGSDWFVSNATRPSRDRTSKQRTRSTTWTTSLAPCAKLYLDRTTRTTRERVKSTVQSTMPPSLRQSARAA
jgi:hypothetical protein